MIFVKLCDFVRNLPKKAMLCRFLFVATAPMLLAPLLELA